LSNVEIIIYASIGVHVNNFAIDIDRSMQCIRWKSADLQRCLGERLHDWWWVIFMDWVLLLKELSTQLDCDDKCDIVQ